MKKIIAIASLVGLGLQLTLGGPPTPPPAPTGCIITTTDPTQNVVYICGANNSCAAGIGYASYTTQTCYVWCLGAAPGHSCSYSFVFNTCTPPVDGPPENCCVNGSSPCAISACGNSGTCDPPYGP